MIEPGVYREGETVKPEYREGETVNIGGTDIRGNHKTRTRAPQWATPVTANTCGQDDLNPCTIPPKEVITSDLYWPRRKVTLSQGEMT